MLQTPDISFTRRKLQGLLTVYHRRYSLSGFFKGNFRFVDYISRIFGHEEDFGIKMQSLAQSFLNLGNFQTRTVPKTLFNDM